MYLNSAARIVGDRLRQPHRMETYWAFRKTTNQIARLTRHSNRRFARVIAKDLGDFLLGLTPVEGEVEFRAKAAADWLLRAQAKAGGGGVSLGFFPCDDGPGWFSPYPETTGYIITSLLKYSSRSHNDVVRQHALQMATWEIDVQMSSGAVQGGPFVPEAQQSPCAFNTG